ncbi:MAG: hypothetical protein WDW36_007816 [Sanguina aurantia]
MPPCVSQPSLEIQGGGGNASYVTTCTELFLGGKGIEKLRGFESFVNLESLWLNNNRLKKVNNLEANFRIRTLYLQANQICTLKGSLLILKFLQQLDLSDNALRNLEKQLKVLEKFKFLTHLNLKGNPLCEEPEYRLLVIHTLPSLRVLDQHAITAVERNKAKAMLGVDAAARSVAFLTRAPLHDPAWDRKVAEHSQLEQDLRREATQIRAKNVSDAYMRERALFMHNPNPDIQTGTSLPPNAGMRKAMAVWQQQQAEQDQAGGGGNPRLPPSDKPEAGVLAGGSNSRPIKFEDAKYQRFLMRSTFGKLGSWTLGRTVVKL